MIEAGLLLPGAHRAAALADDRAVARAILRVEDAWVTAQSRTGLVPAAAAEAAHAAVDRVPLDEASLTELAVASEGGGNPVIPLLAAYRRVVEEEHGRPLGAVHAGLTSQDVMDTTLALVVEDVRGTVLDGLDRTGDALAGLAVRHRDTVMVGRTLTQHALPVSFGLKAASWLAGVDDAADDVAARAHLPVSFGGAAGTLAATVARCTHPGDSGQRAWQRVRELLGHWAEELGLELPDGVWHTNRVPVLRAAGSLAETTAALSRMANDVLTMSRPEVGELREPAAEGRGVSSAMPQKQNPVLSVLLKRTGIAAPALLAQVVAGASAADDERPDGGWHAEWPALRELAVLTAAASSHAAELAEGLTVGEERMTRNLADAGTGVMAERLNTALAPVLGERDGRSAKQRIQAAVRAEPQDPDALAAALAAEVRTGEDVELPEGVAASELTGWIRGLLDPRGYLGAAPQLCERAAARHDERKRR
ncbi:lyase family protein [Glutamicibacter protophormiae]|uniref:3-carboxy-cis,cis-muconate cycloisomerase n=2 Tax=Kocuria TaxID=57493 RepID=A0A7D7Q369_KOCVA|nr:MULTISPECIES: lyase family protein [Kocuria]MDN5632099.1 3-carboxy-cis,cis-muconate cycloisomerase [Kocuria sp.]QMS55402.1 3-carboxy-cis,cis-muconate cycloisomerase [Kocuria varians]RUP82833.1 3-carboxy-cis,cis-muconate cycloisomerase [Kocuria sp. HSID17590]WNB89083.1 lyase family protein [Glutamicibacter protophormiae]